MWVLETKPQSFARAAGALTPELSLQSLCFRNNRSSGDLCKCWSLGPSSVQEPRGRSSLNLIASRASWSGKIDSHHTLVSAIPGHWLCAVIDATYSSYGTQQSLPTTPQCTAGVTNSPSWHTAVITHNPTVHSRHYLQSLMVHSSGIYKWGTEAGNFPRSRTT